MLVLASLSMFLVSTTFMALPILLGRAFFHSISFFMLSFGLKHDGLCFLNLASHVFLLCIMLLMLKVSLCKSIILDICAFWIGFCILRGIYIITCFVYDHFVTGRVHLLINHFMIFIRNFLLFSIWVRNLKSISLKVSEYHDFWNHDGFAVNRCQSYRDCSVSLSTL